MATIKDVAKYAGVSHGTVSNVINGLGSVSLENVKKVEEAIQALGYKPNIAARNLKSNKLQEIAVILPSIAEPLYAALFTALTGMLENEGYKSHLYLSNDIVEKENEVLDTVIEAQLPGAIIMTCQPSNETLFQRLLEAKTKFVFLEREPKGIDCNFVGFDNRKSILNSMKYLKENGYSSPALITGAREFSSEKKVFDGFHIGIVKYDFPLIPDHIRTTTGTREEGFRSAIELLHGENPVDAFICSTMQLFEGVTRAVNLTCTDKKPFIIALGDDAWNKDNRENALILPRPYFELSEKAVNILLSNVDNPAFYEYQQTFCESEWNYSKFSIEVTNDENIIAVAMVDGEMATAIKHLLPDLKKKTGMEISLDAIPEDQLYETICDSEKRNKYDVFSIDALWLRDFHRKGFLADLTPYIDETFLDAVKVNPELFHNFAKVDNRYFAIPYHYSNQLLFYRRDLFENPINKRLFYEEYGTELRYPRTWMEYNAVARFFTKEFNPMAETQYGTTLGGDYPFAAANDFLPRFWGYGANLFDKAGCLTVNSKSAMKALENYCESYRYASPASAHNWLYGQVEEFISGKAAMMILNSSYVSKISNPHYSKVCGKVNFAPVPGNNSVHWIWNLTVNEKSTKKDLAIAFLRWICDEDLAMPTTILGNISACSAIGKSGEIFSRYPWIIKSLNSPPKNLLDYFPNYDTNVSAHQFMDMLAESVHKCVVEKLPAAQVLETLEEKYRKICQR